MDFKLRSTSDEMAKHFPYDHVLAGAVRRRVGAKQAGEAALVIAKAHLKSCDYMNYT